MKGKQLLAGLLQMAGIAPGGSNPWDITIHNEALCDRVLAQGSLGLGEAYMDSWWDCQRLDMFFDRVLSAGLDKKLKLDFGTAAYLLKNKLLNRQKSRHAFDLTHYDTGNDLFAAMLDKRMVYTCGYWLNAATLDEAQEAKLDLVCRKLQLRPGMRVLDIGCGWGSFMKFAAENYGVSCVGATISRQQAELGRELCKGLPVEFRLLDYRQLSEQFDAVVSIGMFEHVGYKNYAAYMDVARRCLKDNGLFLLHTIGSNVSMAATDPWIHRYIFQTGMLPSVRQIGKALEGRFVMEDWHNFGPYYDRTLMTWHDNFERAWDSLKERYGERFRRMWRYYLLSCAGGFRSRQLQLWQIVLSKEGIRGGYVSIRDAARSEQQREVVAQEPGT